MLGSYYLFVRDAHPHIPNAYVAEYHKWTVPVLFAACVALYVYMCASDPGVIRADNVQEFAQYPNHPVLFPEGKYCRTCKTIKYGSVVHGARVVCLWG
jgi:hypothetical protein